MFLADSSVWIEHFRSGQPKLAGRLCDGLVLMHPCVSGELACGGLKDRETVLSDLAALPTAKLATDSEVMHLGHGKSLGGRGLGWFDAHLLASALLPNCRFGRWTKSWSGRL